LGFPRSITTCSGANPALDTVREWGDPFPIFMSTSLVETPVLAKTRELCQVIVNEPDFGSVRRRIDTFMGNEGARDEYQSLVEKSEHLHHKQHQGVSLTQAEIDDFERLREKVMNNPVAREFIEAQREMQKMQQAIHDYVSKTFELGRLPTDEDMSEGSCGHGCGCDHNH
jgi:cell fate (sporulation/competence/biofilm development) regulator YlbF (YheA/YmcA/DUF963 family)